METSLQHQVRSQESLHVAQHRHRKRAHVSASALCSASNRAMSLNGLNKHAMAPCSTNRDRTASSRWAVMKITGTLPPPRFNSCCSSGPLIPGIAMSRIRHFDCDGASDARNASAEQNVRDEKPNCPSRSGRDSRSDSSSSTMHTRGLVCVTGFSCRTAPSVFAQPLQPSIGSSAVPACPGVLSAGASRLGRACTSITRLSVTPWGPFPATLQLSSSVVWRSGSIVLRYWLSALGYPGTSLPRGCNSGSHGMENATEEPGPSFGVAHSRPRWASIIERLTESPMPMPSGFVV